MSMQGEIINDMFSLKLDDAGEKTKLAEAGGAFIRDRLREESFARQILPPKTVTPNECQRSTKHDTLVYLVETEPRSRSMTMSFRAQPTANYYQSPRFEVPFSTIGSEQYEQTEQELMAYKYPITDWIKKNIVKDIQEVEDLTFLNHCESAVQAIQKEANGMQFTGSFGDDNGHGGAGAQACTAYNINAGTCQQVGKIKGAEVLFSTQGGGAAGSVNAGLDQIVSGLTVPAQKDDFIRLKQLFVGRGRQASRLRVDRMLITDYDFEDLSSWSASEVGYEIVKETTVDGYKYNTVLGIKYIRTLKTDILRPGNIYAFAAPEFFGGFLVLNKTKFYLDKKRNRISMEAWEDIGMYIGNIAAVRKLELYAGSTDAGAYGANTISNFTPVEESELGKLNNRVAEGANFPLVSSF